MLACNRSGYFCGFTSTIQPDSLAKLIHIPVRSLKTPLDSIKTALQKKNNQVKTWKIADRAMIVVGNGDEGGLMKGDRLPTFYKSPRTELRLLTSPSSNSFHIESKVLELSP